MEANLIEGKNKDEATMAILSINPNKKDDGSSYKCVVHNRAMPEGKKYEAKTQIFVNCKYLSWFVIRT